MNKKFILIVTILLVFIVNGCINPNYLNDNKKNNEIDDTAPPVNNNASIILDSNNPLALESKKVIIDTGISENYFDEHFKLIKVVDGGSSNRRVEWEYTINDYKTIIFDEVGFAGAQNIHGIKNQLYSSYDIKDTIPRNQAEDIMKSCIGKFKEESVKYMAMSVPGKANLYLFARSVKETSGLDIIWDVGYINLETGGCIKDKGGIIHSPLGP